VAFRENPFGELKLPLALSAAAVLLVAAVAAIALLLSDRRETFQSEAYGVTRRVSDSVAAPVTGAMAAPVRWGGGAVQYVTDYFFAVSENRRLRAELKEARQWRDVAIALSDTNERYKALLGLKTDPPIPMVAAHAVADSRGPFANTRILNAGDERNIRVGNPVLSENGLVGRIVGVTRGASRMLLLTDVASRTPVMIDRTNARAILSGDGGPNPKLDYLRGKDPVMENDRVLTSGDGGVIPRGLPVGRAVKGLDGRWRVVLASDAAPVDFVRILLFQDFRQLINTKQLDSAQAPPPAPPAPELGVVSQAPAAPTPKPAAAPPAPAAPAPKPAATSAATPTATAPAAKLPAAKPASPKPAAPKPAVPKPATATPSAAPTDAEIPH